MTKPNGILLFRKFYFLIALGIFLLEIYIAVYVRDDFFRPYAGDLLIILFLYAFLRSFIKISIIRAVVLVLLFSFIIEGLQALKIVPLLGLEDNLIASTILGNYFEFLDLLFYCMGVFMVLLLEYLRGKDPIFK